VAEDPEPHADSEHSVAAVVDVAVGSTDHSHHCLAKTSHSEGLQRLWSVYERCGGKSGLGIGRADGGIAEVVSPRTLVLPGGEHQRQWAVLEAIGCVHGDYLLAEGGLKTVR